MKFQNPINGYVEEASGPVFLWVLLFGSLYFAIKGIWTHAVVSFFLTVLTAGISWFLYPFFGKEIVKKHYLKKGWKVLEA